ncbi:TIGR00159 family protein [Isachenkonia alkalipeptolytica]|uniref:Diadenylate cyclase n=1 Tax=Isachenkonia alkalipeptolytica TaxID=2565777 RepID=A0AA43XPY8_9CLOT|nr:diadenylate cyclase CdaA [Isachenkonia alkalipeptolytica]NBG89570.1 TIGR00159 family protein [Isachenkonia alkalipeptolytica]
MREVFEIVQNIGFKDLIDIGIVAYVFYKIYMLLKETRAKQLVKGIVVLLVVTQLSEWFQLHVMNWILINTMTVGLIALLIVFQPELRRALEYIGRTKLLSKSMQDLEYHELENIVNEMMESISSLSRQKIGALIVIEKDTGLSEIAESGTILDANISRGLLINIFMPNTPLHDGAIIIRNNKILAAACFLPLSDNPSLSKDLGTRHRAGVGISEKSDAFVVMVSEETGAISVAQHGKLSRFLDTKTLKTRIVNTMKPERTKKSWRFFKLKWRQNHENDESDAK